VKREKENKKVTRNQAEGSESKSVSGEKKLLSKGITSENEEMP